MYTLILTYINKSYYRKEYSTCVHSISGFSSQELAEDAGMRWVNQDTINREFLVVQTQERI